MKIAKPSTFELNFYSAGSVTNHCQRQSGQDTLYTPTPEPTTQAIRNAEANLEKLVLRYAEDNILVTRVRLLIALFDSFTCFWYQVFMKDPYYMKMTRDRQMSRLAFFGSAGGWLGLCCGLSIISVCKTVYHDIIIMIMITIIIIIITGLRDRVPRHPLPDCHLQGQGAVLVKL